VRDLEHPERRDPGGEAGEAHQRQGHDERADAAHESGQRERREVADGSVPQHVQQARHDRGLLSRGDREHACRPRADCDEADVAEGKDARVADEHVERDDDRDLHESVGEVRLRRDRDDRAEDCRSNDEQRRADELLQLEDAPHTRSTEP